MRCLLRWPCLGLLAAAACTNHPGVAPWEEPPDPDKPPAPDFAFQPAQPGVAPEEGYRCGAKTFETRAGEGQIMLVLDRSGSMQSKWAAVTSALIQTVRDTQTKVSWGLLSFPDAKGVACSVADSPDVPIAPMNFGAISASIGSMTVGKPSGSPVRRAIRKATEQLAGLQTKDPKYIVLATDGAPNCRDDKDTGVYDAEPSIDALRDAAKMGFHTFVIGIASGGADEGVLSDLADAGLEAIPGSPMGKHYYSAQANAMMLSSILKIITTRLLDCVFPLDAVPPAPDLVKVEIDGQRLTRDTNHMDGWDYLPGQTSIQLFGPSCERLRLQDGPRGVVEMAFGCPNEVIR